MLSRVKLWAISISQNSSNKFIYVGGAHQSPHPKSVNGSHRLTLHLSGHSFKEQVCVRDLHLWYILSDLGMHHCPRPRLKGIFETTYKHDYRGYKPKPKAYPFSPPEYKMRHYDKESLETSYDEYNRAGELIREKIESRRLCSHKGNRTVFEDAGVVENIHRKAFFGITFEWWACLSTKTITRVLLKGKGV